MNSDFAKNGKPGYKLIFCRFVYRNGVRIYPKKGKFFRFWVKDDQQNAA